MPPLVFISPEGEVLSDKKPSEVRPVVEEPLWKLAEKAAAHASTNKKVKK